MAETVRLLVHHKAIKNMGSTHPRMFRIAALTVGMAAIAAFIVLNPAGPRDLWIRATTRAIPFEFSSLGMCDERDAYQPDELSLSGDRRSVQVLASLNCADKPGQPSASQRYNSLFLRIRSVPVDPESNLAAACYCSNKVVFTLEEPIPAGREIVFVNDGFGSARFVAP